MCGIAGYAGFSGTRDEMNGHVRAMCDAITHRGPDSSGYFVSDGVFMGMRRLSIIDVAGGQQPIANEDGTVTVVFNGEIYNHHRLRQQLQKSGHVFRTHSDTEVLVHLYEEMGPAMVGQLHGMFAFSIWDSTRQQLFIARDRTGMKPLYYQLLPDGLAWGSELRSLLALGFLPLSVSPASVFQYLAFGYVPEPNSIFAGVHKLPPGHSLLWSRRSGLEVRQYWGPPPPDVALTNDESVIETLRSKLDHAVASHLESEVPLGAFLSGGLDSSTVVALMSRHATGRVKTFSIGFSESEYDESVDARRVAEHFGTDHTELIVKPDARDIFADVVTMFDEPFGDSSSIPTFLVAQLARRSVTVALSGDGGDELFGGYARYGQALRQRQLSPILAQASGQLGRWLPHGARGRNRLMDLGRDWLGRYAAQVLLPVSLIEGGVGRADVPGGSPVLADQLRHYVADEAGTDLAARMMRLDLATYLPGDILTKVDRTTMAVSLEARVPFLDADLVDFALSIPGRLHVDGQQSKLLFRRAIQGLVPDFVLKGRKRGFAIPLATWFRGPLRDQLQQLVSLSKHLHPYVDRAGAERLVREHLQGRRDHSALLWRLMVLERWLESLAGGELSRPPRVPQLKSS